jgi:alanine racemase
VGSVKVWVEVSEERLVGNFQALQEAAGAETEVLAVVKANAYGHGVERCSVTLAQAGARWLGVTCANEGMRARWVLEAAGFGRQSGLAPLRPAPEILVMCGFLAEDVAAFVEHGLTPVVWTAEQVEWLRGHDGLRVHVEVDTGMGRQGVHPGAELDELLTGIAGAGLVLDGIFTHFCESEVAHSELTQTQERRFEAAVAQVRERGLKPAWVHAGNSSSVDNPAQERPWLVELAESIGARAMVRTGLGLYGYCLPIEEANAAALRVRPKVREALRPVMQWKTHVLAVRELAAGETVGYGAMFTAREPMRVALLPVGYADGLRRELSSTSERPGGWVVLHESDGLQRRASILGRVSMNLTVVDVTGIGGVAAGDEVVLLGDGVTAEDHARLAGTIPYEILCGVRER